MRSRGWMVPTLPIAAIACATAIVGGGLWSWSHWYEWFPPAAQQEGIKLDAAFDKVLSEADWIAAGLPGFPSGHTRYVFTEGSRNFTSSRGLEKAGPWHGSLVLDVESPPETAERRDSTLEGDARRVIIAEGFEADGKNVARSWQVFADRSRPEGGYWDLAARCFHDAVSVKIWTHGPATGEQAEAVKRLIEGVGPRLARACETDLKPFIDRAATGAPR